MPEEKTHISEDNTETAFSSPVSVLNKVKTLIFGEDEPELIMKISIYINLTIWFIFFIWNILSYYAISYREVILKEKKINVEIMIFNRGSELGFDPAVFLHSLLSFHRLSIICWLLIFVGIVFMWRQKKIVSYFLFIPLGIYYLSLIFYLGFTYFLEDTTLFDKIMGLLFILNSLFFLYMFKKQKEESDGHFFTE